MLLTNTRHPDYAGQRDGGSPSPLSALHAPDPSMQGEYEAARRVPASPEKRLCLAMIAQAANDLQRGAIDHDEARSEARAAWHWIMGRPVKSPLARLTFAACCAVVGVDEAWARRAITQQLARDGYPLPPPPRREPPPIQSAQPKVMDRVEQWVRHRTQRWSVWQLAAALDISRETARSYVTRLVRRGAVRRVALGWCETVRVHHG